MSEASHTKVTTRQKVLAAAVEIAHENGAANLSLDAVAARAGVSKGGLLYHFPTKAALMKAVVGSFMEKFEGDLNESVGRGNSVLSAIVDITGSECSKPVPGAAALLAAIAEDPDFLRPVQEYERRILERLKASTDDNDEALIIYLALEGLRSMQLFDLDVLSSSDRERVIAAMRKRALECTSR